MAKHVTLIGMMGSGKSSVAPLVAARLNRTVIEVDQLIEEHEQMPIGEIFIAKGEAYFRRLESELIGRLLSQPPAVFSLGGGAFQWEATRELLLAHSVVFYLSAAYEVLTSRLQSTTSSPKTITRSLRRISSFSVALIRSTIVFGSPSGCGVPSNSDEVASTSSE